MSPPHLPLPHDPLVMGPSRAADWLLPTLHFLRAAWNCPGRPLIILSRRPAKGRRKLQSTRIERAGRKSWLGGSWRRREEEQPAAGLDVCAEPGTPMEPTWGCLVPEARAAGGLGRGVVS